MVLIGDGDDPDVGRGVERLDRHVAPVIDVLRREQGMSVPSELLETVVVGLGLPSEQAQR